jgi:energy-coupling factor transporter ATP-binding protein EcfA2
MSKKIIFFAYEDGHQENRDAIIKAAQGYNTHQGTYKVVLWENLKQSGSVIGSKIFNTIKECEIFACDLTYLNHNVFFELGYAIACKKKLKIFLNQNITNAKKNYSDLKILRNIEYTPFSTSKEINDEFQQRISSSSLQIKDIIPGFENNNVENDIFFINMKNKNQAAMELEEYLSLLDNIKYILNSEDEIAYQPLIWYLKSIINSKIVILHLLGKDKTDYEVINAEYSLYAGIALGLGKKVLLIAPNSFSVPIDYSDILIEYSSSDDCLNKTEKWLDNCFSELKQLEKKPEEKITISETDQELNLLRLGIGYGVAEQEKLSSAENFVEIDPYNESLNPNRKNIVIIGRKGSGKSEIFLRLNEIFISDKNNYIIVIKPDSDEILGNTELTNLYNNDRSKRAFFSAVWKYVIFSKIFQEIVRNIEDLNFDENEKIKIRNYYQDNKGMFGVNFFGMIIYISKQYGDNNITQDISLLDKIYEKIQPMIQLVVKYFQGKKYQRIIILADNLDSGWNPRNNLELQSIMINVLIEYINKLGHDIGNEKVNIHSVLFLRKDIFNYILKDAQERDKLMMDTYEINWERFPEQLNMVINNRLLSVLGRKEKIEDVWKKYFSFRNVVDPYNKIQDVIIKRPRDAIYFMSRLFESAVNRNKLNVDDSDFIYAQEEYSKFLNNNLILEIRAVFPRYRRYVKYVTGRVSWHIK